MPNSFKKEILRVQKLIDQGDINGALNVVHDCVEKIVTEPICVGIGLGSPELDRLCLDIGRENFHHHCCKLSKLSLGEENSPTIAYILSRFQRSGGHSRLVQEFIRAQPDKDHLIFLTGIGGKSDEKYISKIYSKTPNVNWIISPKFNFHSRLTWLQNKLLQCQPEYVHIFCAHQDSVAIAAPIPELGLNAIFYHHGDHHLSLGVHLKHFRHVDLHPMGYHHCRSILGVQNNYLPLSFTSGKYTPNKNRNLRGGALVTATIAGFNKVEIPYSVSYVDLVPNILAITGGYHLHVGKLTLLALLKIRKGMDRCGIDRDRFIYIEWAESIPKVLQKYCVDVYIASFPYGACLTMVEVMSAGVPVILHRHIYSRVLSGLELAYSEAFSWSDPEELYAHLAKIDVNDAAKEGCLARLHFEKYYNSSILANYLQNPKCFLTTIPPLNMKFSPRNDEWSYFISSDVRLLRLISRKLYRILRKFREMLFYF